MIVNGTQIALLVLIVFAFLGAMDSRRSETSLDRMERKMFTGTLLWFGLIVLLITTLERVFG